VKRRLRQAIALLLASGVTGSGLTAAAAAWRAPEAALRFELTVARRPTHPEAGFVVELPDGGLLPGPAVTTRAFTAAGQPVDSYTLWHNPARSLVVVMAAPAGVRDFTVYVEPARQYRLWSPETGLAPSAIIATDPTQASLAAAGTLAGLGRVPPPVHFINKPGVQQAPLSLAGDETGRPRPASFYMLAHVTSADPGRTWVAPFTLDGSGEIRVNGRALTPQARIDKWGGTGDWAEIKRGPNRLEILHSAPGTQDFFTRRTGGLVYLTWRTPNATMQELGGVRSEDVPMSGTSRMETRLLRDNEILRSGDFTITRGRARDGRPLALLRHAEPKPYWFDDETPLLAYTFEAIDPQPDVRYTWTMPGELTASGPRIDWLLYGFRDQHVTLTAESPAGKTTQRYPLYGFSTRQTSLNDAGDRRDFRRALRHMAEAAPVNSRAFAALDPTIWRTLLRTAEYGKGVPLMRVLFTRHPETLARRLAPDEREALEDLFLDSLARIDNRDAVEWINRFHTATDDRRRREELTIRAAEIYMHYRQDTEAADRILQSIVRSGRDDAQRILHIRLGDLALLAGDLNEATRRYAGVQNHSRIRRSVADRQHAAEAGGRLTGRPVIGAGMDVARADDWKLQALVDAAASESVKSLLNQGYLLEAREMLRLWERDLPLSKISADFIILEARFFQAADDPVRAVGMLRAYCSTVDTAPMLHEAAPLLIELMIAAGEPPAAIRETAERLRKRLEFHPVSEQLGRLMQRIPATARSRGEVSVDE